MLRAPRHHLLSGATMTLRRMSAGIGWILIGCVLAIPVYRSLLVKATAEESNWPQWRGPEGRGISTEKNLPLEWSATQNVQWKTPIPGRGHSSPIIWGRRVFLTTSLE